MLHVVESPVARTFGSKGKDYEMQADQDRLQTMATQMKAIGHEVEWQMGTGNPVKELARMINEYDADLVLLGGHGHAGVSDLIHGTVINGLRHQIHAKIFIVPLGEKRTENTRN